MLYKIHEANPQQFGVQRYRPHGHIGLNGASECGVVDDSDEPDTRRCVDFDVIDGKCCKFTQASTAVEREQRQPKGSLSFTTCRA